MTNPWIYAGILSTSHSFIVDNFSCGEALGKLNEYGAIAQDYRGPVGTSGGTATSRTTNTTIASRPTSRLISSRR